MLLAAVGWAKRIWALPFLTVLAPSERYAKEEGKQHKKITDWARQMLLQVKRWLPDREVIVVGDSSYAVIELLAAVGEQLTVITRLRLDAALYEPCHGGLLHLVSLESQDVKERREKGCPL